MGRGFVVVTGASRGLGALLASHVADRGFDLALCARSASALGAVADSVRRQSQRTVLAEVVDVSNDDEVLGFARRVTDAGRVVGLINNAAVLGPVGRLTTTTIAAWRSTVDINLGGVAAMTAAFLAPLTQSGSGSIINVCGGGVGGPSVALGTSAYVASKFAVAGLTECLGRELEGTGVRVNAVSPGAIESTFNDPILEAGPELAGSALFEATLRQRAAPVSPEGFLRLVDYLLDDGSSWLTGRLLSARWDDPDSLERDRVAMIGGSRGRLRRIDGDLFEERMQT